MSLVSLHAPVPRSARLRRSLGLWTCLEPLFQAARPPSAPTKQMLATGPDPRLAAAGERRWGSRLLTTAIGAWVVQW